MSKSGFCDYIKILNLNLRLTFGRVDFCNIGFSTVCFSRQVHVAEVYFERKRSLSLSKIKKALLISCFKTWDVDSKQNEVE